MIVIKDILQLATQRLTAISTTPRLDAELLLCHICSISREQLICSLNEVLPESLNTSYQTLLQRRLQHEPIAYIIGCKEFWGLQFSVNSAVLIPRPETEILVERALEILSELPDPLEILDLGTGSGCIAIAIGSELLARGRQFSVIATDKSTKALAVARNNLQSHKLKDHIALLAVDWLTAIKSENQFNLIVSNPPYVVYEMAGLSPELGYEPQSALFASDDGLNEISKLTEQVGPYLGTRGAFLCEIGAEQGRMLLDSWQRNGGIRLHKDLAGNHRVLEVGASFSASTINSHD